MLHVPSKGEKPVGGPDLQLPGVAPGAKVMPLRVLDSNGYGTFTDVADAFEYAGQHGIRIVNASLGGASPSVTLEQAVADNPNTLYVVAAGNNSTDDDDPSTPYYPCAVPEANVICVGASDQNDRPASFTNYGAASVDLFAPGVNIASAWTGGRYVYASGTSMESAWFLTMIGVYREAERHAAAGGSFVFLGDVFNSTQEPIYVDEAHLGPRGNELIAQAIASFMHRHTEQPQSQNLK